MILFITLVILYLAGIEVFSYIFKKNIKWIQYIDSYTRENTSLSPMTKAIWMAVIWPITAIPFISWYVVRYVISKF
jgi:hypothetical protein